jgi:hypothetical protein
MSQSLVQSLQLTLLGMGMTFLSIGALVAGMFLLTRLTAVRVGGRTRATFPGRVEPPAAETALTEGEALLTTRAEIQTEFQEGLGIPDDEAAEMRRRAAAAAVAVALALQERPAPEVAQAAAPDAWNVYARSLHLSGRARYESLRGRR